MYFFAVNDFDAALSQGKRALLFIVNGINRLGFVWVLKVNGFCEFSGGNLICRFLKVLPTLNFSMEQSVKLFKYLQEKNNNNDFIIF